MGQLLPGASSGRSACAAGQILNLCIPTGGGHLGLKAFVARCVVGAYEYNRPHGEIGPHLSGAVPLLGALPAHPVKP